VTFQNDADETLSRLLAKVLRHEIQSLGVPIQSGRSNAVWYFIKFDS